MTTYNPVYGELLNSKEVVELTGFTLNQLRNQRQRPETSPFPFVRLGGTSMYRKEDIYAWLEQNGGAEIEYIVQPHHKPAPLAVSNASIEKKQHLAELAKITTSNAYGSRATWFIEQSGYPDAPEWQQKWGKELWAEHVGITPEEVPMANRAEPERYWSMWTWSIRKAWAVVHGWDDITNEDIRALPIGEVPPKKIT